MKQWDLSSVFSLQSIYIAAVSLPCMAKLADALRNQETTLVTLHGPSVGGGGGVGGMNHRSFRMHLRSIKLDTQSELTHTSYIMKHMPQMASNFMSALLFQCKVIPKLHLF